MNPKLPPPARVGADDVKALLREQIAEECAIELAAAYVRGQLGADVVGEKRQDYALADKIISLLPAPTGRRKKGKK